MVKMNHAIIVTIFFVACTQVLHAEDQLQKTERRELLNLAKPEGVEVGNSETPFSQAAQTIQQKLEDSTAELRSLREQVAAEQVPLSRELSRLESELASVRLEYKKITGQADRGVLAMSNLKSEIKSRQEEASYLSNLLSEYINNFESRLHIAEIQRYREELEAAKLAPENSNLSEREVYEAQARLLSISLDRLNEALGGTRFDGTAVDSSGLVTHGTFSMIGPAVLFMSDDNQTVGTVEQRLGSLEPTVIPFGTLSDTDVAMKVVSDSSGLFPLDPTLGNAHKIEKTKETLFEHIQKGGPVMYPIFTLAGAAMLVAIFKWIGLAFVRRPSGKKISALLDAISKHDTESAMNKARAISGPVGRMLVAGVEHIREPRELIEEVMYEKVLATRLKLNRFLPFIAISAASAPLLGLLGTVTGIINTFKLITVFGSGDVKTLSGGISEALITTEFGLIVAIPSLLLHAFLSRKARCVINEMEKAAVALVNQVSKTPYRRDDSTDLLQELSVNQSRDFLRNMSCQIKPVGREPVRQYSDNSAGSIMSRQVVSIDGNATVAEAIDTIRAAETGEEIDCVFIVDGKGKYVGNVLIRHLLTRPEQTRIESLANKKSVFVRVDTHRNEAMDILGQHDLVSIPVLDHNDQLVGRITRNGNGDGK
jgi:biopolymer transport protein ExbB